MIVKGRFWMAAGLVMLSTMSSQAYWQSILADSFGPGSSNQWVYTGVTNGVGRPLFQVDEAAGNVTAEWDQTNGLSMTGDPYTITASRLSRSLSHMLTDDDTFRFGFTLNIVSGSIPDTVEFSPIVSAGLYNLSATGPDRNLTDDFSTNTNFVKDVCDFVEFNYFVNNNSAWFTYPSIQPTIGAHVDGLGYDWILGSWGDSLWHNTDMGANHWLPVDTNLYIEVRYYGAATNEWARRAFAAIYTDPARTQLLAVNGVEMYYWTLPVAQGKSFTLTDYAICNFVDGVFYGGPAWHGAGAFDDVYVDQYFAEGEFFSSAFSGPELVTTWAAVSGKTYYLQSTTNFAGGDWITNATVVASGETACATNLLNGNGAYYRVTE